MKQTIRLTESELHNMISETVANVLSEMDPRTYISAGDKRREQGDNFASKELYKHASNKMPYYKDSTGNMVNQDVGYDGAIETFAKNKDNGVISHTVKAANDFRSGKTTYKSKNNGGQGWANYDESVIRNIVKECIKKLK